MKNAPTPRRLPLALGLCLCLCLMQALPAAAIDFGGLFGSGGGVTADNGSFEFKSGSKSARLLVIGMDKTATVTQTGGTISIDTTTLMGRNAGSSGTYQFSGGQLITQDLFIGENGKANFVQSGGSLGVKGVMRVRDRYTLSGGGTASVLGSIQVLDAGQVSQSAGLLFGDVDMFNGQWNQDGGLLSGDVLIRNGSYTLNAGTLSGQLTMNGGIFTYHGGSLLGRVVLGSGIGRSPDMGFYIWAPLTLPGGLENNGDLADYGHGFTFNGAGLDNLGQLWLRGGMSGTGAQRNRGVVQLLAQANMGGTGGFVNEAGGQVLLFPLGFQGGDGRITYEAINPRLSNTGTNLNRGLIELGIASNRFTLDGAGVQLQNTGRITLQGATLDGSGALFNQAGGRVEGFGQIQSLFSNEGALAVAGGFFTVTQRWINRGQVDVAPRAVLAGAEIDNRASLTARGYLSAAVQNAGLLTFGDVANGGNAGGSITNARGGVLRIGSASDTAFADVHFYGDVVNQDGARIEVLGNNRNVHFDARLELQPGSVFELNRIAYLDGPTLLGRNLQLLGNGTKVVNLGSVSFADVGTLVSDPGSWLFGPGSTLQVDLRGTPSGLRGSRLSVGDELVLRGGQLVLNLDGGTPLTAGMQWDLLDWGSLNGSFGQVVFSGRALAPGLAWNVDQLYTRGVVSITAVPEPATALLR